MRIENSIQSEAKYLILSINGRHPELCEGASLSETKEKLLINRVVSALIKEAKYLILSINGRHPERPVLNLFQHSEGTIPSLRRKLAKNEKRITNPVSLDTNVKCTFTRSD